MSGPRINIDEAHFAWLMQLAKNRVADLLAEGIYHEEDRRYENTRDRVEAISADARHCPSRRRKMLRG